VKVRGAQGRRRAAGAAALAALAALAVSGCSSEGGAAAVVDGKVIPLSDVHTAMSELRPYLREPTPTGILEVLVIEPTVARVAAEHGVVVSPQQVEDRLAAQVTGSQGEGAAVPQFSDPSLAVGRFVVLQEGLQQLPDVQAVQEDIASELEGLDVEVNPRYGSDFSLAGIAPAEHPWLVPQPEPEPAAP
jgi:hypothetical protein